MFVAQNEFRGPRCPRLFGGWLTSFPTGDQRNPSQLVGEHTAALNAVAFRLCGNLPDARDLVQDTLERALRSLAQNASENRCTRPWLLSILHHLFIDRCRAAARDRRLLAPSDELDEGAVASMPPDPEPASAWESITQEQLREAVEQLDERFRSVYLLHTVERHSYKEIAEALSISQATVGTRLIRARRRLKQMLLEKAKGSPS